MNVLFYFIGIVWLIGSLVKHKVSGGAYNHTKALRIREEQEIEKYILSNTTDIIKIVGSDMFDMLKNGHITVEQEKALYDRFDIYLKEAFGSDYRDKNLFPLCLDSGVEFFSKYHMPMLIERNRMILLRMLLAEHGNTDFFGARYGMELGNELQCKGQLRMYKIIQRILRERGSKIILCLNIKDNSTLTCAMIFVKHFGEGINGIGKDIDDIDV